MTQKYKALLLIVVAAVLGAGIAPFSKLALAEMDPASFNLLRFVLAAVVMVPVFLYNRQKLNFKDVKILVAISLFAVINTTFFIFGLRYTTAINSQLLYPGVPLIVSVLSYFLIKENFSTPKILGLVLGFLGLIFVIAAPAIEKISFAGQNLKGNLLILTGVASFALYSVLCKKLLGRFTPVTLNLFFVLTTIVVQILLLPILGQEFKITGLSNKTIFSAFYVGFLGIGLHYTVFQYAIKISTPTLASMILYLQPVFVMVFSYFLLSEKITLTVLVGGATVLLGVALVTLSSNSNAKNNSQIG